MGSLLFVVCYICYGLYISIYTISGMVIFIF